MIPKVILFGSKIPDRCVQEYATSLYETITVARAANENVKAISNIRNAALAAFYADLAKANDNMFIIYNPIADNILLSQIADPELLKIKVDSLEK